MPEVGGVARRATIINQERDRTSSVLVLDAGDSIAGDMEPAVSTKGESSIQAMNRLGYSAALLGPADLSLGTELVKERMAEAKFPLLSADMTVAATGEPLAPGHTILNVAGRRIAVAGISAAPDMNGFKAADPFETARRVAAELAGQADALILLSRAAPEVNQRIADEVPGISAIIEGGAPLRGQAWISAKTGTPIYHADQGESGHAGRIVGVATLRLEGGKLLSQKWRAISLGPNIKNDPQMLAWSQAQPR